MKRLLGAIVDGFGLAAGKKIFDEVVDDLVGEEDPAKAAERAETAVAEQKRAEKEQKRAEKERARAEKERELAAMKKRLGKQ